MRKLLPAEIYIYFTRCKLEERQFKDQASAAHLNCRQIEYFRKAECRVFQVALILVLPAKPTGRWYFAIVQPYS